MKHNGGGTGRPGSERRQQGEEIAAVSLGQADVRERKPEPLREDGGYGVLVPGQAESVKIARAQDDSIALTLEAVPD
jgi:hypothetical protein